MCKPASQIIFCTCDFEDDFPDDYWILHRFSPDKNDFIIGEPRMPYSKSPKNFYDMKQVLLNRLNSGTAFDKPLHLVNGDIMVICIVKFDDLFAYRFNDASWEIYDEYDQFELVSHYNEIKNGTMNEDWLNTTYSLLGLGKN